MVLWSYDSTKKSSGLHFNEIWRKSYYKLPELFFCVFFIYVCCVISLPFLGMTWRSVIKAPVKFYFSCQPFWEREHLMDNIFISRVSFPLSIGLSCHYYNQNFKAFLLLPVSQISYPVWHPSVYWHYQAVYFPIQPGRVRCQADCWI